MVDEAMILFILILYLLLAWLYPNNKTDELF